MAAFTITLIDAASDTAAATLTDGAKVAPGVVPSQRTIDVAFDEPVGSIRIDLVDGTGAPVASALESIGPYSLTGDAQGDYNPPSFAFPDGRYGLTVTAYSGARGTGDVLGTDTIGFLVDDPDFIVTLVDASTDQVAATLADGVTVGADVDPDQRTFEVDYVGPGAEESVFIRLFSAEDDVFTDDDIVAGRVESLAPYTLFGDRNGDYLPPDAPIPDGDYQIRAFAYPENGASGGVLSFDFVDFTLGADAAI
jgi:hypothetical protein